MRAQRPKRPWWKKKRFYLLALFLGFYLYAYHFLGFRMTDAELSRDLAQNELGYRPEIGYREIQGRRLRFVEIGADSLPLIVFIHGAPSSSSFWVSLMKNTSLLSQAKLLAVDRPGYGKSGYGLPELSVRKQAAMIAELIRQEKGGHPSVILHGSSYGGTVAARLCMDYPDLIDGVLLQSASLAPGQELIPWISRPSDSRWLRWLVPPSFRVATREKLSHRAELAKMLPYWGCIQAACIILQGDSDGLIYPENAVFARNHLPPGSVLDFRMVPGRGHDLLWTRNSLLVESLLKLVNISRKL